MEKRNIIIIENNDDIEESVRFFSTDAEKYRLKVDFPMFNIIYCNEEQFQNRKRNGIFAICTQYCLKKEWIMSIEDASVIVMGKQVKSDEINRLLENKKIKSKCIDKYMNIEMAESIISMIANCADRKTFLRKRNNKYTWKFRAYKEMAETKNMQIAVVGSDTSSKLVFDIITKMRVNTSYYNICNQKYYLNGTECGYNMFAKSIFNSDCIIIGDTYKRFVVNKEILETIKDDTMIIISNEKSVCENIKTSNTHTVVGLLLPKECNIFKDIAEINDNIIFVSQPTSLSINNKYDFYYEALTYIKSFI